MAKAKLRRGHRRGFPVAVLVTLDESRAVIWRVYSEVAKPHLSIEFEGKGREESVLYGFHERVISALKPVLNEGVRSVVVATSIRNNYGEEFLKHVRKHHAYLVRSGNAGTVAFRLLQGSAGDTHDVTSLARTKAFHNLISESTSEEADGLVNMLEEHLNGVNDDALVLFSLNEIEDLICSVWRSGNPKPEYVMLTDKYLADSRNKGRIHRLLQISENKKVKTRIVDAETNAGKRLSQLGGLVCLAHRT